MPKTAHTLPAGLQLAPCIAVPIGKCEAHNSKGTTPHRTQAKNQTEQSSEKMAYAKTAHTLPAGLMLAPCIAVPSGKEARNSKRTTPDRKALKKSDAESGRK